MNNSVEVNNWVASPQKRTHFATDIIKTYETSSGTLFIVKTACGGQFWADRNNKRIAKSLPEMQEGSVMSRICRLGMHGQCPHVLEDGTTYTGGKSVCDCGCHVRRVVVNHKAQRLLRRMRLDLAHTRNIQAWSPSPLFER